MKKIIFLLALSMISVAGFTQTEKYIKAMEALVPSVDTTRNAEGLVSLANSFERIATAEKVQWLPFYYAALSNVSAGYMQSDGSFGDKSSVIDPYADKAEVLLNQAEALSKDNSEIWTVKKMIATLRMMGNPMARYMQYAPLAAEALEKAKKLNAENPRVYLLEAEDLYHTPEQFGGSKTEAKKLFEEALKKYAAFKPESTIHPSWGKGHAVYFLSQIK